VIEPTLAWSGGPVEVAERTWFSSFFCSATAFETDEGLLLVDSGTRSIALRLAAAVREVTTVPVHTAVYTHGHVDHAYGLPAFLVEGQPAPTVVAHRAVPERFARYERTAGFNRAINARQFGGSSTDTTYLSSMGSSYQPPVPPDVLYDDQLTLRVGGVDFELHHGRGETDDATWVWCGSRRVVCTGDFLIGAVPNAGNPQKVQRYPLDWAAALRAMAACEPVTVCPGHGGPVVQDAELAQRVLLETAGFLETIVERTLEVLDDGAPPHVDVVRRVELPVSDSPWLQPLYDEGEFIVRNVIREYGGWYSGRPSELKPAPRSAVAAEIAALSGGVRAVVERAVALADGDDLALACHLADYALEASPDDADVRSLVAALYERRAKSEQSFMAVNLFRAAAADASAGRPFA
jgi:glyoxylase-like metal-dependent hydrolase (beta-lactamase superfamily II)